MSDTTVISIIMPVYNMENSLPQALESVLKQTFTAWELIVIDDKSSDKSLCIAQSFAKRDARIRVIALPEKAAHGTEALSKLGFQETKPNTEYIAFLSGHDFYFPYFLEKLYRHSQLLDQVDIALIGFHGHNNQTCYPDAWSWLHLMNKKLDRRKHNVRYIQFEHTRSCIRHRSAQETWSKPMAFYLLCGMSPIPWRKLYRRGFLETLQLPESQHFVEAFHWMSCTKASNLLFCDTLAYQHDLERTEKKIPKLLFQAEQVLNVLLQDNQQDFYLLLWMRSLVAAFCFDLRLHGLKAWQHSFQATQSMLRYRMAKDLILTQILKPTYKLKFSDFRHLRLNLLEIIVWNLLCSCAVKDQTDEQCDQLTTVFLALLHLPVASYWRAARDRLRWLLAKLFL